MKKMDIYGEEIYYEKMVGAAYKKGCGFRFYIKDKKDVRIKERPKKTEYEKKKIGFCFSAARYGQDGQAEKTAQSQ
jgi:hypothetical protein